MLVLIFFPCHNTICTVTCLTPYKNNVTLYCPNNMNTYVICFSDIDYVAFCADNNYTFNWTYPNIVVWTVC